MVATHASGERMGQATLEEEGEGRWAVRDEEGWVGRATLGQEGGGDVGRAACNILYKYQGIEIGKLEL